MMFNFPLFPAPFYRRYPISHKKNEPCDNQEVTNIVIEENTKKEDDNSPLFEIFGIKLYSDDILILLLLFFLYSEKVDDQWLYITLIMLLLS